MNVLQFILTAAYFGLQVAMALLLYLILRVITNLLSRLVDTVAGIIDTNKQATLALARSTEMLARANATIERLSLKVEESKP